MDLLGLSFGGALRDSVLAFLVVVIAGLFLLAVAFGVYTMYLRIRHERRDRRWKELAARWQEPVLLALADPEMEAAVHEAVEEPYRLHFVRFCLEYARRVRGEERRILQRLALPYLDVLRDRAQAKDIGVRTRAVQTLGTLGLPRHVDVLIEALDDPSPLVAMVAARGLAHEDHAEHTPAILARLGRFDGWSRSFMASMLANMGLASAPALRASLGDAAEVGWVRSVAGDALRLLKDIAAGDVAAAVVEREEDPVLVASALRLLTVVGRPEHIEVIRIRCASPDATVRSYALRALGTLAEEDDVPRLLGALSDPSPWVAIHAARGLMEAGGTLLLQDLADSDHPRALLAGQVLMEEQG